MDLLVIIILGFIICCIVESIKDRIDTYSMKRTGDFTGNILVLNQKTETRSK